MIGKLIEWCVGNRLIVVILTVFLALGGVWAAMNITVDAIPDLSDVQVIVRAEYPGQAPQIVEQQVTYPLTTSMLAVPGADVVRGYSMFGTSFVYVIFDDGTDIYWARSRVLEQLSAVAGRLPEGVTPELGPDATGVGWIYQYALVTGGYCPEHPQGVWHDETADRWYASPDEAPGGEARERLVHHRVFEDTRTVYADMAGRTYDRLADAPEGARAALRPLQAAGGLTACPLDGEPLVAPEVDLAELRSIQDWYLRYELVPLPGVSEVASVGGFVKQYQVVVDPVKLLAYGLSLERVRAALEGANREVGGSVLEMSETEYMVRGRGYLGSAAAAGEDRTEAVLADLRLVALAATAQGSPIYLRDVADVRLGPEMRRGVLEWGGRGETAGGIVVMRFGENARDTIDGVKAKLAELERTLPPGVAVRVGYDRSDLIDRAMETVGGALAEEILIVSLVILVFLLHARSALVAAFVVPTGVLASLLIMHLSGINANIMALGGIALAIGVMVDSSIIMVENAHKHFEQEERRVARGLPPRSRARLVTDAAVEVGPSLFFSLLIITVSFLPVFALGGESGRMFKPLAYTKSFAMAAGAVLAVTIIPVMMVYLITERVLPKSAARWKRWASYALIIGIPAGVASLAPLPRLDEWRWWIVGGWVVLSAIVLLPQRVLPESRNPISLLLQKVYDPAFAIVMRFKVLTLVAGGLIVAATLYPLSQLGSEFMPPLEEGDLLYMPTTVEPGLSITKAKELLQQTDKLIATFPEVASVYGKVGRADTATDPAPMNMIETVVVLHRDKARWRHVPVERFYSGWPGWLNAPLRRWWPTARPITTDELVYGYELADGRRFRGMNEVLQIPGLANSWTMPIRTRIDMLATGIRTPVGVKVLGPDLDTLTRIADDIAQHLRTADSTAAFTTSAFAEKGTGGSYLDIEVDRQAIARYGLSMAEVQDVVSTAIGGMNVTYAIEGLERYPVNLRYPAELRDNVPALEQVLVMTPGGAQVPLAQLATIRTTTGPPMIKSENARLTSWVYVDLAGIDVGTYVERARRVVDGAIELPPGYSIVWSGQFENMAEARARLLVVVPVTLVVIVLLLYLATRSWLRVGIVMLAVPFSLVGAIWLVYLLDYNLSLAVWIGMIALLGLDAETGLVMLLYLDQSHDRYKAEGRMRNADDLWWAVHDGAVKRIRPKTMTVVTDFIGLMPLMWAEGAGADTMRRLAAPVIGGLASSFLLELLIYPILFYGAKRFGMWREQRAAAGRLGAGAAA